jgi:hypothetical protein
VHRDLKPENLLVTPEGRVKISDFGIAKATNDLGSGTALTSTGVTVGTPNYMAPEQATAQGVGPWTDLYSVGMMAFEFFVGRPAFGDTDSALGVLLRQVNEEIPAVSELDPRVDPRLSSWIGRMVAKEPAARPGSAGAAWDEVEDTLIALLGARWQREARLGPVGDGTRRVLPLGPTFIEPPTEPLADRPLATTMPPSVVPEAMPAKRKRQVGSRTARLIIGGVAVVAAAAALLGRSGGSSAPGPVAGGANPSSTAGSSTSGVRTGGGGAGSTATSSAPSALLDQQQNPSAGGTSNGQSLSKEAKQARDLAKQYDNAAAKIEGLSGAQVAGSPTARLAAAMRRTAAAYRAAAAAAARGDRAGYTAALTQVSAAKKDVNAALADVRAAGTSTGTTNSSGTSPAGSQPAPVVPRTPCSGDSVSDDPSDESC